MKDIYIYPAIFHLEDVPMANTQGEDLEDALYMAKDCLAGYISRKNKKYQKQQYPIQKN